MDIGHCTRRSDIVIIRVSSSEKKNETLFLVTDVSTT